ncbi:unnamed protein product [Polarella glacialis]|uniref:50S ribosomal protein L19, chloroplastic n=1 Tax=Polarella glacialis TaxID=89957 RepID=A0A813LB28_POLGL|nr:unnamed protein product [Polarella glacialis]
MGSPRMGSNPIGLVPGQVQAMMDRRIIPMRTFARDSQEGHGAPSAHTPASRFAVGLFVFVCADPARLAKKAERQKEQCEMRMGKEPKVMRLAALGALVAAGSLLLSTRLPFTQREVFVGTSGLRSAEALPERCLGKTRRLAEMEGMGDVVDAEVAGEEDEEEMLEDEDAPEMRPAKFKKSYAWDQNPPQSYFDNVQIDRHKVNMVFMDMFKRPKSFFPHKLKPGDTIRVYYLEARAGELGDTKNMKMIVEKNQMRETFLDGIIMNFKGEYHARTLTMRTMQGKGENACGYEFIFPVFSPLITKIDVIRRGYIGRNKNAYFIRAMVGKKNTIPLDVERTKMDEMYANMIIEGRQKEIPESEYPAQEWETYPLPAWKQDMPDWEEKNYDPKKERRELEQDLVRTAEANASFGGQSVLEDADRNSVGGHAATQPSLRQEARPPLRARQRPSSARSARDQGSAGAALVPSYARPRRPSSARGVRDSCAPELLINGVSQASSAASVRPSFTNRAAPAPPRGAPLPSSR